jgi:hypothetical protein
MIPAAVALIVIALQPSQPPPSVKALDWMIGCWATQGGERTSWESWTKASDDAMFGMSYSLRAGKVTEFEFLRVEVRQGKLVYLAQPNGNPVTAFELVPGGNAREAIFAVPLTISALRSMTRSARSRSSASISFRSIRMRVHPSTALRGLRISCDTASK